MGGVHASALRTELVLDLLHLLPHGALVWETGDGGVGVLLLLLELLEVVLAHLLVVLLDDAWGEGIGDHGIAVCHGGRREPRDEGVGVV
ncbi:hypothetical protein B0H19DRAFT_1118779 [Mycena capillaripes]|nr:hypothetical protein B0H19DRAFT_1118779 [Mycena capillaripes]